MKKALLFICIFLGLLSQRPYAQVPIYVPVSGLQGYWDFSDNFNDLSDWAHHGVNNGMSFREDRFMNVNNAIEVRSAGNYVEIDDPMDGALDPGFGSFSLSAWVAHRSDDNLAIFSKMSDAGYSVHRNNNGEIQFVIKDSLGQESKLGGDRNTLISYSNWHHIVAIRDVDRDSLFLYKDGIKVASTEDSSSSAVSSASNIHIGIKGISWTAVFGAIDDIAYWNRASTMAEITQLYNSVSLNIRDRQATVDRKKLEGTYDLYGRKVRTRPHSILLNKYSDGSVKKVFFME